jgi:hypothetical protein
VPKLGVENVMKMADVITNSNIAHNKSLSSFSFGSLKYLMAYINDIRISQFSTIENNFSQLNEVIQSG